MSFVYLGLGSNLGNKQANLKRAISALDERVGNLVKCSSFYRTLPEGFVSEKMFLKAVFETTLPPEDVLRQTEQIEKELGRIKKSIDKIYTDRCIDIDILFYDDIILHTESLIIPHPLLHQRRFVLEPLKEIAPHLVHPILKEDVVSLCEHLTK